MLTEDEFRADLASLTDDQPPAPDDRMVGIHRIHRRRRGAQTIGALAAVVVVIAAGAAVVTTLRSGRLQPAGRDVPSWALTWPDHENGSLSARQKAQAVAEWEKSLDGGQPVDSSVAASVVWYFAEKVMDNNSAVVVFEAVNAQGQHRLITAVDNQLSSGPSCGNACSNWGYYDVPAPAHDYTGIIGVNAHRALVTPAGYSDAWAVILTPPSAKSADVEASLMPNGRDRTRQVALTGGAAVVQVGQLYGGSITVSPPATDETAFLPGVVGVKGSAASRDAQLAEVMLPMVSPNNEVSGGGGAGTASFGSSGTVTPASTLQLNFECRGVGSATVVIDHAGGGPLVRTRWSCNGVEHEFALSGLPVGDHIRNVTVKAGEAAWAFQIVKHRN